MAKTAIQMDTTAFNQAMFKYSRVTGKGLDRVIRDEMRLLVERLVHMTPPFTGARGGSTEGRKQGEGAILKDMGQAFFLTDQQREADRQWYESMRNARGRFPRIPVSVKHPVNRADLKAFVRDKFKRVGMAKAGWLAAAHHFRAPRVPAWVSRHPAGQGSYKDHLRNGHGYLEALNRSKAIGGLNQETSILANAIAGRLRDLEKKIVDHIAYESRKISAARGRH